MTRGVSQGTGLDEQRYDPQELREKLSAYFQDREAKNVEAYGKQAHLSEQELSDLVEQFEVRQGTLNVLLATTYGEDLEDFNRAGQLLYGNLMAFYAEEDPEFERTAQDDVAGLAKSHFKPTKRAALNKKLRGVYGIDLQGPSAGGGCAPKHTGPTAVCLGMSSACARAHQLWSLGCWTRVYLSVAFSDDCGVVSGE